MSVLTSTSEIVPTAYQIAICLCIHKNSFLLLLRNPQKPLGLLWCAPGGKLGVNEPPNIGAIRELFEETGIKSSNQELNALGSYVMSYEAELYQFHLFLLKMENREERIALSYEEHIAFTWVDFANIDTLDLMPGLYQLLEIGSNYIKGNSPLSS